jgi:hypothetical protein
MYGAFMSKSLDDMAIRFFKLYAQYESTLKEKGYFRSDSSCNVIVDWDKFSNEVIGKNFKKDACFLKEDFDYILDNPPMRQVVRDGCIIWENVSAKEKSVQMLFSHISRVRNTLFHGAKFNGSWLDPQRSERLLSHSLSILEGFRVKILDF